MHAGIWTKFLFGQTDAILKVAGSRASLWTGIILVLLTSIPRNYDVWVLFAASVEVLVVFFFGGGLAKSIMAAMGGMRNSPEEEIMRHAMNTAFFACLWLAPISLVVSLVWWPKQMLQPLPRSVAGPIRWDALMATACAWVVIAIIPQRELAKTVAVERLMAGGRAREALDFLATHQPGEFAPARPLPPKPFERSVIDELPECFAVVQVGWLALSNRLHSQFPTNATMTSTNTAPVTTVPPGL